MSDPTSPGLVERALAPYAFLVGIGCALLTCCVLGRVASRHNPYKNFTSFHPWINPISHYHPTPAQARAIVASKMAPDRIAVIVGGNSIMNGSGQGEPNLWTRRLQEQLGERFLVFNFGLHGCTYHEFGGTVAEIAARDWPRVIFVANAWAGAAQGTGEPDGTHQKYFFWHAYYKGLLARYPERDARLAEHAGTLKGEQKAKYDELKRRARLDRFVCAQDLWTTFSYRYASSVWCPAVGSTFTKPRVKYPDLVGAVPAGMRYAPNIQGATLHNLQTQMVARRWAGGPDYGSSPLAVSFKRALPEHIRQRTLVAVIHCSPFYVQQFPPDVRAAYEACFPETMEALRQAGYRGVEVGRNYGIIDFNDECHVSAEGAPKMAADLAPHVRALAVSLGYLPKEGGAR